MTSPRLTWSLILLSSSPHSSPRVYLPPRGGGAKVRTLWVRGSPRPEGGVGWHCPLRRQSPCGRGPPPPSSCMAHWGVLGRGDRRCGKNILLSFMSGKSRLSDGSHLSPSQLGNTISFSATVIETKKIPCFFSSFFLGFFFPSFLPLTTLSCKEETPTYVLSHLHGSEDFTSLAQFNDLGWIFTYRS